jgi:hypothetical protein
MITTGLPGHAGIGDLDEVTARFLNVPPQQVPPGE